MCGIDVGVGVYVLLYLLVLRLGRIQYHMVGWF